MTEIAVNLSDTSTWLPLDGLAPGFDANKAPLTSGLAEREIVTVDATGERIVYRFAEHTVAWEEQSDPYEAFEVDEQLYFVQFHNSQRPAEAVSLVLDLRNGCALTVRSVILAEEERRPGQTRVQQTFAASALEGSEPGPVAPVPTSAFIGRRVLWVYSDQHAYEHIYLSSQWYTWQCLAGPEKGLADTDENSVWEIRPGIYVFAWREKVIPCGSVTIADHRNIQAMRAHGSLFGLDETGTIPTHFTFGAFGRLLSATLHPAAYDPAESVR
jgi:hypothetical protein